MSKRGSVSDYAGDEIRVGDLVAYASRRGNRVRMSDAVVLKTYTKKLDGRVYPMLRLAPTGNDSGWLARHSDRIVNVAVEHVRVIRTAEELAR